MNRFTIIGALLTLAVVVIAVVMVWPAAPVEQPASPSPIATTTPDVAPAATVSTIGQSVEGRPIEAYTFGTGETDLLFVGGIHGGYEENTVRLAKGVIEEFQLNPMVVPSDLTIHIIPNLNPDGYAKHLDPVTNYTDAAKRFNANGVDLNRNFDCNWAPESSWRGETVSAGTAPFSEPEAAALRDYVLATQPDAAVFWHSSGDAVFTSACNNGVLTATETLMNTYAIPASYQASGLWTAYAITGDAEGWLASIGIPAITVELETKTLIDWQRNWAGTLAVIDLYSDNLAR